MDRAKAMTCSLLPALWVLAAGNCLAGPWNGGAGGFGRPPVFTSNSGRHAPLTDVRSFEQPTRMLRRLGMQLGCGGVPATDALAGRGFDEIALVSSPLTVCAEALGLARCWQFHWRTACEPRAPSSVS